MKKRLFALCLGIVMLLGMCITVPAETPAAIEYVKIDNLANGGFETISMGAPKRWDVYGGSVGTEFQVVTGAGNTHSGDYALRVATEDTTKHLYMMQKVLGVKPGASYTVKFWVNVMSLGKQGIAVKMEAYNDNGKPTGESQKFFSGEATPRRWVECEYPITAPEGTTNILLLFRMYDGGEVYWDDISCVGEFDKTTDVSIVPAPVPATLAPMALDGGELFKNTSFEEVDADGVSATGWKAYQNWGDESSIVSLSKKDPFTGDNCVRIATRTGGDPWIHQVAAVEPNTEYQFSIWYKTTTDNLAFKLEFYHGGEVKAGASVDGYMQAKMSYAPAGKDEQWLQYGETFTTPDGCDTVAIYPRLFTNTEIFLDDASLYKVSQDKIIIDTDRVFYYSDREEPGVISAIFNTHHYQNYADYDVQFKIMDGVSTLWETPKMQMQDIVSAKFGMDVLVEKQKDYASYAILTDKSGKEVEQQEQIIAKWDRPTRLTKDGKYVVDGKEVTPFVAYDVAEELWPTIEEGCVNTVRIGLSTVMENTMGWLNKCEENGLLAMASVYANMKPTAFGANARNYSQILENGVAAHPALFAYLTLDEPQANWNQMDKDFREAYKLLRSRDPQTPIMLVEAPALWKAYRSTSKYCDIMCIDPYTAYEKDVLDYNQKHMDLAFAATDYKMPVMAIYRTYGKEGEERTGFPGVDELRHQIYTGMFDGMMGFGFYNIDNAWQKADGTRASFTASPTWEGLKEFKVKEYDDAVAAFVRDEYPIYSEQTTADYRAKAYVKDGKVYLIALSTSEEDKAVTIPLSSSDGSLLVEGFTANAIGGAEAQVSGNGSISYTIPALGAVRFEITPENSMDFSALSTETFVDLNGYAWAREQIEDLRAKGIVNVRSYQSFAPGEKITRGELAMFLVRTLGLTGNATESFADVPADAEYAKEIAIGKQHGILNGIGDNKYNPEAEITRQDLMTIIARGMQLSGAGADLSAFSDADSIADYARDYVAAMVQSGLVKGNADGTLNPRGNTTRAEAAVIMQRIIER